MKKCKNYTILNLIRTFYLFDSGRLLAILQQIDERNLSIKESHDSLSAIQAALVALGYNIIM